MFWKNVLIAIKLLVRHKLKHKIILVKDTEDSKNYYKAQNKMDTFPQIFIRNTRENKEYLIKIGGYDNLTNLLNICFEIKDSDSLNAVNYMCKLLPTQPQPIKERSDCKIV